MNKPRLKAGAVLLREWMGGSPPLGCDPRDHQLLVSEGEAAEVREILQRYLRLGSVRLLKRELDHDGIRSKQRRSAMGRESGGRSFSRGALYNPLSNSIYIGEIRHKGASHPGQHTPIIERDVWNRTLAKLRQRNGRLGVRSTNNAPNLLTSKLFDDQGDGLTPTHTKKGQRRYRYYVSRGC